MDNEKLQILRLLIENQEKSWSIRQIALARKINYKSAHNNIQALAKEGVVNLAKHGNITLCTFNLTNNPTVYTVEHSRLQELLKDKNFKVVYKRLSAVNTQFILLLFGSHAKSQSHQHSDIDLLLITDNPQPIEQQINLLPLPIHLTAINYADFATMLKSKEFTVVSEAIKKNIILFGVEDYYRMINNAR